MKTFQQILQYLRLKKYERKVKIEKKMRDHEEQEIIKVVSSFIKDYWDKPENYTKIVGLETRIWNLNSKLALIHRRQIRGDLIQLHAQKCETASWVDQSHAYSFLGINDVYLSQEVYLTDIIGIINRYRGKH